MNVSWSEPEITIEKIAINQKFCPACGYELPGVAKFCIACGAELNKQVSSQDDFSDGVSRENVFVIEDKMQLAEGIIGVKGSIINEMEIYCGQKLQINTLISKKYEVSVINIKSNGRLVSQVGKGCGIILALDGDIDFENINLGDEIEQIPTPFHKKNVKIMALTNKEGSIYIKLIIPNNNINHVGDRFRKLDNYGAEVGPWYKVLEIERERNLPNSNKEVTLKVHCGNSSSTLGNLASINYYSV